MKLLTLQYPDGAPLGRIIADAIEVSKGPGSTFEPAFGVDPNDTGMAGVKDRLTSNGLTVVDVSPVEEPTGAVVEDGAEITIGADTYTFTVVDGVITDISVA